uniref:Uncharacterized protein n=1 Tax=Pseudonaja textilis TaxID=8673 RepID=A0A670YEG5_PSETE
MGEVGGVFQYHAQQTICASRAKYSKGCRPRAICTVNLESQYLLIQEEFTKVYLIKFLKIQSAKATKRKLDEQNFFGSFTQETRDRRKHIAKAINCKGLRLLLFLINKWQEQTTFVISSIIQQPLANGIQQHIHRTPSIFLLHIIIETYYISFRTAFPESLSSTHYSHHCATKSACFYEDNKLALLGREPNTEETIFGPTLQKIPKIDTDNSMNTTAILILNRLKKVAMKE